jgi:RimJ/RimL family protein N-acetyltransferase
MGRSRLGYQMIELPELSGERLGLRALQESDLPAVLRWRSDSEVTKYWVTRDVPTLDDLREWLAENRRSGSWTWVILDERGDLIGYTDVFGISREHQHCELSLMIGERDRWGSGYARETLMVLLQYLLSAAETGGGGMHKVSLSVFAENIGARRAYEACGFQADGVLREDMWYDGRWHDQILMSVLADEFQRTRGE